MSGVRPIDEEATKKARARHERGRNQLLALYGVHPDFDSPPRVWRIVLSKHFAAGKSTGIGRPMRLRAYCPPVRDKEHARKHKARKRAHESRRRNR